MKREVAGPVRFLMSIIWSVRDKRRYTVEGGFTCRLLALFLPLLQRLRIGICEIDPEGPVVMRVSNKNR